MGCGYPLCGDDILELHVGGNANDGITSLLKRKKTKERISMEHQLLDIEIVKFVFTIVLSVLEFMGDLTSDFWYTQYERNTKWLKWF